MVIGDLSHVLPLWPPAFPSARGSPIIHKHRGLVNLPTPPPVLDTTHSFTGMNWCSSPARAAWRR